MHLNSKILLSFIATIILIVGFDYPQVFAEIDHYAQISGQSRDVLSPALVLNSPELLNSFTNSVDKETSLTEILGHGSIEKIFDVGTGNGSWMRDSLKQPWASDNASIIGFELEEPDFYPGHMQSVVDRKKNWHGLKIIHATNDPDFPKEEDLDLIHESFMDVASIIEHEPRLNLYDSLLKPGGWLLFSHVSHKYYIQPEKFTDWLSKKKYLYQVFNAASGQVPTDYPTTFWWDYFKSTFSLGHHSNPNYLIVAQKMPLIEKNNPIKQTFLLEQSI